MSAFESIAAIFARLGITPVDRDPEEQQEIVQASREAVWHAACQRGHCRYAVENVKDENPPPVDSTITCGGYHGERVVDAESGQGVWRWRPCVRHLAWRKRRQRHLSDERDRVKALTKGTSSRPQLTDERDSR